MERWRVFYTGLVQGVGFRYTATFVAQSYQVAGWVQNLADGRVELLVEGNPEEIKAFLNDLAQRMGGNIHSIEQLMERPTGEFSVFDVAK
jgi:acylphosphatase